ncbi:MAG: ubiquitin-like small modifier protein 1 [Myxococcota bacterium]
MHVYATLRPIVGGREVDVPLPRDGSVIELARAMVERWPDLAEHLLTEDGHLSRRVNVFVGGRNARWLDGEATRLSPDARVDVFPPVAGG